MSYDGDDEHDDDEHDGRRNTYLAVGLGVVALAMVGVMFWVMSSIPTPALTVNAVSKATPTSTAAPAAAAAPASTTTFVPPSMSWTQTETPSLPPPEQPTMTAPTVEQTPSAAAAAPAPAPAPAPTTVAAPAPPPPPQAPNVSKVNLTCSKESGKRVTGKLSFTTTTKVDVTLVAGGSVAHKQAGPGDESLSTSGRGAEFCAAQVGGQNVGPIPAS